MTVLRRAFSMVSVAVVESRRTEAGQHVRSCADHASEAASEVTAQACAYSSSHRPVASAKTSAKSAPLKTMHTCFDFAHW